MPQPIKIENSRKIRHIYGILRFVIIREIIEFLNIFEKYTKTSSIDYSEFYSV